MAEIINLATYRAARLNNRVSSTQKLSVQLVDRRKSLRFIDVERRIEPRYNLNGKPGLAITLDASPVVLSNVSPNGLMAGGIVAAVPGSRILVRVPACVVLSGRVIWKHQGMAGIQAPIGSLELYDRAETLLNAATVTPISGSQIILID